MEDDTEAVGRVGSGLPYSLNKTVQSDYGHSSCLIYCSDLNNKRKPHGTIVIQT